MGTSPLASIDWKHPQAEMDRLKSRIESFTNQQPPQLQVALATAGGCTQGAVLGVVMGSILKMDPEGAGKLMMPPPGPNGQAAPNPMAAMQNQSPFALARNFAVLTGVQAGLNLAIKHARGGKEDIRGAMGAAFGGGFAFSLVGGMGAGAAATAGPLQQAFSTGVIFALFQGGLAKLGESFGGGKGGKGDDSEYVRAKYVLENVGYPQYERNLKRQRLTDSTIMLWNDRFVCLALRKFVCALVLHVFALC